MAKGNKIIVEAHPRGRFEEIIVVGTPKPGTHMYPTTATRVGGRRSMEPAGTTGSLGMSADGHSIPRAILLCWGDHAACPPNLGVTDAYTTGSRGAVYYPEAGEDVNVLFHNESGTGDDVAIGDKLIVDDGSGGVVRAAAGAEDGYVANEAIVDPTADQLIWATSL